MRPQDGVGSRKSDETAALATKNLWNEKDDHSVHDLLSFRVASSAAATDLQQLVPAQGVHHRGVPSDSSKTMDFGVPQVLGSLLSNPRLRILTSLVLGVAVVGLGVLWRFCGRNAVEGLLLGIFYIAVSAALIRGNKFLMHSERFPFPSLIAFGHTLASLFVLGPILLLGSSHRERLMPSWDESLGKRPREVFVALCPVAVVFVGGICLSIAANLHCSVAFLQMVKEPNVVLVYVLALAFGLDAFDWRRAVLLFAVVLGAMAHGRCYVRPSERSCSCSCYVTLLHDE